jgi:hypothetical protein
MDYDRPVHLRPQSGGKMKTITQELTDKADEYQDRCAELRDYTKLLDTYQKQSRKVRIQLVPTFRFLYWKRAWKGETE